MRLDFEYTKVVAYFFDRSDSLTVASLKKRTTDQGVSLRHVMHDDAFLTIWGTFDRALGTLAVSNTLIRGMQWNFVFDYRISTS